MPPHHPGGHSNRHHVCQGMKCMLTSIFPNRWWPWWIIFEEKGVTIIFMQCWPCFVVRVVGTIPLHTVNGNRPQLSQIMNWGCPRCDITRGRSQYGGPFWLEGSWTLRFTREWRSEYKKQCLNRYTKLLTHYWTRLADFSTDIQCRPLRL